MTAARRDALLAILPASNLPRELVAWLVHGLSIQAAGGNLLDALRLGGPDLDRRDDLLRTVIELTEAETAPARRAIVSACLAGNREHPRRDMRAFIATLRSMDCPRSPKQLKRIEEHRRQDGWRIDGT